MVKVNTSSRVAEPDLPGACREQQMHFSCGLLATIGERENLDADLRRDGQADCVTMLSPQFPGYPRNVRYPDTVRCLHGTLHRGPPSGHEQAQLPADLRLVVTVPVGCRTHDNLVKPVGLDFVWQITQRAVGTHHRPVFDWCHRCCEVCRHGNDQVAEEPQRRPLRCSLARRNFASTSSVESVSMTL